jgi:murein DD-endopeptidase MepM/ murein hydrolase activator NlpD
LKADHRGVAGILVMVLLLGGCGGSELPLEVEPIPITPEGPIWPLSGSTVTDADSVHSQFGPRFIPAGMDFHAGIDLPAPRGTPVRAVLPGSVTQTAVWNGTSVGAGTSLTLMHANGTATSYLHLHTLSVRVGDQVQQGQVVGTVGSTGATYPHLHLGYFVGMPTDNRNESYSRNPLELLRHGTPEQILATWTESGVELSIPTRRMTVRSVEMWGGGEHRRVDYYDVVARGSALRKETVQFGVRLTPGRGEAGRFPLTLSADSAAFRADRVLIVGIAGDTLLDLSRGGGQ